MIVNWFNCRRSGRSVEWIDAFNAIVISWPGMGAGILEVLHRRLRLDGRCWNMKRVPRVYCDKGLNVPRCSLPNTFFDVLLFKHQTVKITVW